MNANGGRGEASHPLSHQMFIANNWVAPETGGIEFSGVLRSGGGSPEQRPLGRDPGERDVDRLTMMLRLAMEAVEGWTPVE